MDGDIESAERQMAEQFTEPLNLIFREGNPTSIKVMTETMGLTRREVRLPLVEGTEQLATDIKAAVAKYDLK
jgi:dihydrodipicolinate synthase/N-acetylneuraminate lyase